MYPAPMGHTRDEMPLLWTDEEWAAAEAQQAREPIFVPERFAAQMAAQAGSFQTDGYLVLEDVMTDAAREQWIHSLRRCQELNDRLLSCDWAQGVDWEGLGWLGNGPPEALSEETVSKAMGGAQMCNPQTEENGLRLLRQHCVLPEVTAPTIFLRMPVLQLLLSLHVRVTPGYSSSCCVCSTSRLRTTATSCAASFIPTCSICTEPASGLRTCTTTTLSRTTRQKAILAVVGTCTAPGPPAPGYTESAATMSGR